MKTYKAVVLGLKYRSAKVKNVFKKAKLPVKVELVPEPKNKYDQKAIKVILKGNHIGYISRYQTEKIHKNKSKIKSYVLIKGPHEMIPFVRMRI